MKLSMRTTPADATLRQVNEPERMEALHSYQVLDTDPEQVFNDLAQLSAFICGTPMSLVSLIDGERQWFKAKVGLEAKETPREYAFCQYAMRADDIYEVPDAALDERFAQNPLVTGDPNIRFYAGAPLLSPEGQPLGTLCALDTVPRELTEDQREALRILARQVMAHLELRRIRIQLEDERQKLDGVLRMANNDGDALYANNRTEIFVKQDQRLVRIATADLQYVEALGDYVNLHTTRERFTVYGTMKDLETKLPVRDFARVHRKYIVRLDRIMTIEADSALLDGVRDTSLSRTPVRVPIGSSYKAGLLGRLNLV
ncbi:LytTR family transcriptional regulator DNA-binding domain-containing protein [Hymenobacter sp. BT683]|uniref:LytTR family transcriptional regulator DNA-binding domain-containing protein n=1 Tax=Hymenobacter jeongseonensis TaxID=2791027 RepID=A0ABS0IJR5_9BACT|nr:GAF domain-containing DNA-binding protein [Hymenobacter jeongseonensis]MBF9238586.1 LytTR family transcriptional regulator DNA-binding domain-containing protein [Hymenobacter jeongseonensis]